MNKYKLCTSCQTDKLLEKFSKDKQKKDGLRSECKTCKSKRDEVYRNKNKKKINEIQKKYYTKNSDKLKNKSKKWYHDNPEKAKKSRKEWHNNNKPRVDYLRAKHIADNKEFYKQYQREYQKERYRTNLNCRIKTCLNKRLRDYIKNKTLPTLEYIGIPMEELKFWIEYQFEEGMSWHNMGKIGWSFDHVIPCDSFDFSKTSDIFKCYNWTNLRPCWCSENSSKGNNIIPNLINLHEKKVNQFIQERYCC